MKDNVPLDYTSKSFKEQLLFKQAFQGDSVLEVNLTAIEKIDKLGQVIFKILGKATIAAVGTISGIGGVFNFLVKFIKKCQNRFQIRSVVVMGM